MVTGCRGAQRRNREGHREPVVADRVDRAAARERGGAADMEPVRELVRFGAHRAQSGHEGGDAVALLRPQLAGAGHVDFAAVGGEGRQHRELVDQPGT